MKYLFNKNSYENIIICASGSSIMSLIPEHISSCSNHNTKIISVNGSLRWLNGNSDFWFTLDPSSDNLRTYNAYKFNGVKMCMALPESFRHINLHKRFLRVEGDKAGNLKAMHTLSDNKHTIHTGNSAYGALGMAYHMNPRRILLLGVDGSTHRRCDGGYPKDLSHLNDLFSSALPQLNRKGIEVVLGNPYSAIKCFNTMTPDAGLEWIKYG